nr:MAG TPA: hypothetical protein [Caudoviricetes sp.]DAN44227.1 MAG TPA: hypothetical protein [Bacteriophage sp.]DAO95034.1 MAG TPA: hypothetical protein [Caudoviricetes sp.]
MTLTVADRLGHEIHYQPFQSVETWKRKMCLLRFSSLKTNPRDRGRNFSENM